MKTILRTTIAAAASIFLIAGVGGTAQADKILGEHTYSCSGTAGHKGYISLTTWKDVDPDRPNMVFMKAVQNKAKGGGKFRIETYRFATTADGDKSPVTSIAPDQNRAANNFYGQTKSISVTLGNEAWLYWPGARGTQNKQATYRFKFLFNHNSSGAFESSCTIQVKRKS